MSIKKKAAMLSVVQKGLCLLFALLFMFSAAMTVTFAWRDFSQHKSNEYGGINDSLYVTLRKYAIDNEGNKTEQPVSGATFYLYKVAPDEQTQDSLIEGPLKTDENGQIRIDFMSLSSGKYYFLETDPSYGYDFEKIDDKIIDRYDFLIDGNPEPIIVYNQRLYADLKLTKNVFNKDETPLTEEQIDQEFDFVITLTNDIFELDEIPVYKYTINGEDEKEFRSGDTVKLKDRDVLIIKDIPVGAGYIIEEIAQPGYIITSQNHQANIEVEGSEAVFTNTYGGFAGSLIISKKVSGNGADTGKQFAFNVEFSEGEEFTYLLNGREYTFKNGEKILLKHNESIMFINIPEGVEYKVSEDNYTGEHYYSSLSGEITGEISESAYEISVINVYNPPKPSTTTPPYTTSPYDSGSTNPSSQGGSTSPTGPTGPTDPSGSQQTTSPYPTTTIPQTTTKPIYDEDTGAIKIEKTVTGSSIDKNKQFEFVITFADGGSYPYQLGEKSGTITSGDKFYLKHGQSIVINRLPEGMEYTVSESDYSKDGYIASLKTYTSKVLPNVLVLIPAQNEKKMPTSRVIVTKHLFDDETGEADFEKEFEFTITFSDKKSYKYIYNGEEKVISNNGKVKLKSGEFIEIINLPTDVTVTVTEADYTSERYYNFENPVSCVTTESTVMLHVENYYVSKPIKEEKGDLTITKNIVGTIDPGKEFFFTLEFFDEDNEPIYDKEFTCKIRNKTTKVSFGDKIALQDGYTAVISDIPNYTYYRVVEDDYSDDGYRPQFTERSGIVYGKGISKASFVNEKLIPAGQVRLTVRKFVNSEVSDHLRGKEFEFEIIIDDNKPEKFTLKNGQTKDFILDAGSTYSIQELNPEADDFILYSTNNSAGTAFGDLIYADFINKFVGEIEVEIYGEKTWDISTYKGDPEDINIPDSITVYLYDGAKIVKTETVSKDDEGKYIYSFREPKYDKDKKIIKYSIKEEYMDNFIPIYDGYNIVNIYADSVALNPQAEKSIEVINDNPKNSATFIFELEAENPMTTPMPEDSTDGKKTISLTGVGKVEFGSILFARPGIYTYLVREVEQNAQGYSYDQTVYKLNVEIATSSSNKFYIKSYEFVKQDSTDTTSSDTAKFTNTFDSDLINDVSVLVTKVWETKGNVVQPDSVKVQLKRDNEWYGEPVVLTEEMGWKYKWTELEKGFEWTVDEVEVPEGYEKTNGGTLESGYVITNKAKDGGGDGTTVTIAGTKTWEHGSNSVDKYPTEILIRITNAEGVIIEQTTITAENDWSWKFVLPKFDDNDKLIEYKIVEQTIENYDTIYNGYSIINRYRESPSVPTTEPNTDPNYTIPHDQTTTKPGGGFGPGNNPGTGDKTNFAIWFVIMVLSALSLRYLLLYKRPQKKTARQKSQSNKNQKRKK